MRRSDLSVHVQTLVLVAALNIISGLIMLVKDKGHDIAILRTMGATKGAIMRVFLITGASIGVVGTIAGLILGVVFCWNIEAIRQFVQAVSGTKLMDPQVYYLTRLPARSAIRPSGSSISWRRPSGFRSRGCCCCSPGTMPSVPRTGLFRSGFFPATTPPRCDGGRHTRRIRAMHP